MDKEEVFVMKFVAVLIWSIFISILVSYVLTSMSGVPLNLNHTLILGGIFLIAIMFIGGVGLKEEN